MPRAAFLAVLLLAGPLLAATTGRLTVEVKGEGGDPMPGVRVLLQVPATNQDFERQTNKKGRAVFQGLPGGEVIARFEMKGFQIYEKNALIEVGVVSEIEAQLVRLPTQEDVEPAVQEDPAEEEAVRAQARAEELFAEAAEKINAGDESGAKDILERLLAESADFAPAIYQRGLIRLQEGETDGAKEDFERYLELAPAGEFAADARTFLEAL